MVGSKFSFQIHANSMASILKVFQSFRCWFLRDRILFEMDRWVRERNSSGTRCLAFMTSSLYRKGTVLGGHQDASGVLGGVKEIALLGSMYQFYVGHVPARSGSSPFLYFTSPGTVLRSTAFGTCYTGHWSVPRREPDGTRWRQ